MAKWNRRALCLMAGAVLVPGLTVSSAVAAPTAGQQATTACKALSMSVTTGGDHIERDFAATTPPSQTLEVKGAVGAFPQARLAGAMLAESVAPGTRFSGWMIFGDAMYKVGYQADAARKLVPGTLVKTRVGGGWSTFTDFETSRYNESATVHRVSQYALRSDGTLFRWTMSGDTWTKPVSAAGFSSVRTMALISQTRTYDTFVASTKGGSLYTVHLPTDATMKPTVKQISAPQKGWQ